MKNNTVKYFLALLACYFIWGMQPIYWATLEAFDSMFILCCRIIMSVFFTWLYLIVTGRFKTLTTALKDKATMKCLVPAAFFLAFDWGIFIWAATSGRVLDATLGYYMNPLIIFLVGVALFKERGHVLEYIAVAVATAGIIISVVMTGSFPAAAVLFMIFWPAYATITKVVKADPVVSIAIEAFLMLPLAVIYIAVFCRGAGGVGSVTWGNTPLLICSGIVTALPMILYTYVVNYLPFKVVGILQYAGTTITFFCGALFMDEIVTTNKLIMFIFIWIGLVIFTIGSFRKQKELPVGSI